MGRRKSKKSKRRPSRGSSGYNKNIRNKQSKTTNTSNYDLNVPLPTSANKNKTKIQINEVINRFITLNYSTIAFSHTIYGKPDSKKDVTFDMNDTNIKIVKRLNVVIEEISDVSLYSGQDEDMNKFLDGFDIIAISPSNDTIFQAVCSTIKCNIIMLDYTAGRLPFKLKPNSIQEATNRGIVFELCYSSAIVHSEKRKYFIQTGRDFFLNSSVQAAKPILIVSSGRRIDANGEDIGALAIRSSNDVTNLIQVLFGIDNKRSLQCCVSSNPQKLLQRILDEKSGKSFSDTIQKPHSTQVFFMNDKTSNLLSTTEKNMKNVPTLGDGFNIMEKKCSPSSFINDKEITTTTTSDKVDETKDHTMIDENDQDCDDNDGFIAL